MISHFTIMRGFLRIITHLSPPFGGRNFLQNEGSDFITKPLLSDYKINYAVILSRMRCALALMRLTIRSWYSVF